MNASIQNLVRCLIFFSLFRGIKGEPDNNEKPGNIAPSSQPFWPEYNLGEAVDESVITEEDDTEYDDDEDEDFNDNKLGKISVENFKLYKEILEAQRKKNESNQIILQRKAREKEFKSMECLSCFGYHNMNYSLDSLNCYIGQNVSILDCGFDTKECFTELHPYYIKRGCYEPKKLNITFYCKCTLCNDKPADNRDFFAYDNVKDWTFDNKRLQMPNLPGVTAACKYCNTTASGHLQTCLDGTNVEYTICNEGQICFTHVDKYKGIVVRGCANKPAYNAYFDFCDEIKCNNKNHWNSEIALQIYGERRSFIQQPTTGSNNMCKMNTVLFFISLLSLHSINTS